MGSILEACNETASSRSGSGKSVMALWVHTTLLTQVWGTKGVVAEKTPAQSPSSCHFGMRWRMKSSDEFEIDLNCPSAWEDAILNWGVVMRHRRGKTANRRAVGWACPWHSQSGGTFNARPGGCPALN